MSVICSSFSAGFPPFGGIPIFVVTTFDTDYVHVAADHAGDAAAGPPAAGHRVAAP